MYQEDFYNGQVQVGLTPETVLPRDVMGEALTAGMQDVARNVGGMLQVGMQMEDGKHEFEGELALMDIQRVAAAEVESRLQLADGAEGSFFDGSGNLRQVEVANFNAKVNKRLASVGAGIMDAQKRQAMQTRAGLTGAKLLDEVAALWTKVQAQKCAAAWQGAFDAAMAKGDYLTAQRLLKAGVGAGVHGVGTARRGGRRVAARALGDAGRSGKPVMVGGRGYRGREAALALGEDPEAEVKPVAAPKPEPEKPEAAPKPEKPEVAPKPEGGDLTMAVYGDAAAEEAVEAGENPRVDGGDLTMAVYGGGNEVEQAVVPSADEGVRLDSALDEFADTGEAGGVFSMMTPEEQDEVVGSFGEASRLKPVQDEQGRVRVEYSEAEPSCVQRAAGRMEEHGGELTEAEAREMVVGLTMYNAVDDETVTAEQMLAPYKDSGVYEALGGGNAELGMMKARALVKEYAERARYGTSKVNVEMIKGLVDAKLRERGWGNTQWGWREMEGLNPHLREGQELDDVWDRESDHQVWVKWHALKKKYDWYKKEGRYTPKNAKSNAEDEFNENAQDFYDWYMKNEYKAYREHCAEGAKEWYMAEILSRLTESVSVGKDGKPKYGEAGASYASEMDVVREVLAKKPPVDMGYEAKMRRAAEREAETRKKVGMRKELAEKWMAKLNEAKAAKAKREADAKAEAKAKDEFYKNLMKDEEARQKAEAKRRKEELRSKRAKPVEVVWRWDGKEGCENDSCGVWLPESALETLARDLEFDPETERLTMKVGNASCVVLGVHKGSGYLVNSAAALKLNGRAKKGKKMVRSGRATGQFVIK